ncbi:hypothetical protein V5E97_15530 [Singulisphaera sp. Ch08]|uniref:Uncharacterized protein n=1 Tax=Singulisphaera sp. Ch08 TaxID=3120278 RepID=A0AAU7CRV2_9BACT
MDSTLDLKAIFVLVPIFGLLLVGLVIALRSGVASLSTHQGVERFVGNLSQLLLRMAGYAIGLHMLQRFIGAPF